MVIFIKELADKGTSGKVFCYDGLDFAGDGHRSSSTIGLVEA